MFSRLTFFYNELGSDFQNTKEFLLSKVCAHLRGVS